MHFRLEGVNVSEGVLMQPYLIFPHRQRNSASWELESGNKARADLDDDAVAFIQRIASVAEAGTKQANSLSLHFWGIRMHSFSSLNDEVLTLSCIRSGGEINA